MSDQYQSSALDWSYAMGQQSPLARSQQGGVEAYHPTVRDRLGALIAGDTREQALRRGHLAEALVGSSGQGPTGMGLVDFTPAGLPLAAQETGRAAGEGHLVEAGIGAAGLAVPAARGLKGGAKALARETMLPASATELAPGLKIGEAKAPAALSPERQKYPGIVSTRAPWAVGQEGAQHSDILISDYHSFIAHPENAEKNLALVRTPFVSPNGVARYPQFLPSDFSGHTQEDALRFLQFQTDNLRVFGEGFHRAFGDEAVARARLWYTGANRLSRELAAKYGMPETSAAAAYATRSPQMAWQSNVALTDRTAEVYFEHAAKPWTLDMHGTLERIYPDAKGFRPLKDAVIGRRLVDFPIDTDATNLELRSMWIRAYSEAYHPREYALVVPEGVRVGMNLNPSRTAPQSIQWSTNDHIANQLLAMDSKGDMRQIAEALGKRHKVKNFYNDIYMPDNPFGTVTGDTHYAGGANFLALAGSDMEAIHLMAGPPTHRASGGFGIYGLSTEAARSLAKQWGWRPNETQSVTWEGARSVFPREWKTDANKQLVRDLWRNGRTVNASDDEIRKKILEAAGGFKRPEWLDVYPQ